MTCVAVGMCVSTAAFALSVSENPGSIENVNTELGQIEADLGQAHCGGWNYEAEVEPKMAVVDGVPGHTYSPFGDIKTGMGTRPAGTPLEYPGGATGFTSACRPGWPSFYEFHPCQRPSASTESPKIFKPPSQGCGDAGESDTCAYSDPLGNGVQWTCDALCEDLNRRWLYDQYSLACFCPVEVPLPDPPGGTVVVDVWFTGLSYANVACFDLDTEPPPDPPDVPSDTGSCHTCQWNFYRRMQCCTNGNVELSAEATADGLTLAPPEEMNCRTCSGSDCQGQPPQTGPEPGPLPYHSYFRRYIASCTIPETVPGVPDDDRTRPSIPTVCYGLYGDIFTGADYDPMVTFTQFYQRNCVIATSYDDNHFWDMKDTQKNDWSLTDQVEYGQESKANDVWPDLPEGENPEDYKIIRNPTFNDDEDLWYPNLGGGFSLLNGKVFDEDFDNDLSFALLAPDTTEHRAYPQLTLDNLYSSGAYLRAMDDTVSSLRPGRRTLVEWWQELETEAHNLFNTPLVRLQLPPTWSVGLDPLDPLFTPDIPEPEDPANPTDPEDLDDPRSQPIEVMLEAREDLLGEVAAYLEQSLVLRVHEEPIPVVVPFGDPVEYRSIAQQWCSWEMERNETDRCDGAVAPLVQRLEDYAQRMDDVRILRGELATYEALLLAQQNDLISEIGNWLNASLSQYQSFLSSIDTLESLRFRWQQIQLRYRNFHDKTNLPWCMNMRFLPPIFSLLDDAGGFPWLPGRPLLDGGIDGPPVFDNLAVALPRFSVERLPDAVLDFSMIRTATGAMRLPVLKPIQVRLSPFLLDVPSTDQGDEAVTAVLDQLPAALPPIPTISEDITEDDFPDVVVENPPPSMTSFFPGTAPLVDDLAFNNIELIVFLMDRAYGRYWRSLKIDPDAVDDGTEEDCLIYDSVPCIHVEMDLKSRVERLCARPGVTLKEDFESYGQRKAPEDNGFNHCPREDWACLHLREHIYQPQFGWGIRTPDESLQDDFINSFRIQAFEETVLREDVDEADKQKYIVPANNMTPALEVRPPIELTASGSNG